MERKPPPSDRALDRGTRAGRKHTYTGPAKAVTLVTFDGAAGSTHKWKELNDPVMGGAHSLASAAEIAGVWAHEWRVSGWKQRAA